MYLSAYGKITLSPSYNKVLLLSLLLSSSLIILLLLRSFSISMGSDLVILMIIVPQRFVEVGLVGSVRQSRIGFWMITCDGKVRLKLGVIHVCICILWISRSSLIMTIFRQFLQELYLSCTLNLPNFWFTDDNLWMKSQIED